MAGATPPEIYPSTASNGTPKGTPAKRQSEGQQLRDQGAADAIAALNVMVRQALTDAISYLASTRQTPWTADDVWQLLDAAGIDLNEPALSGTPKAMGGAFLAAKNAGIITPAGFTTSSRRARHAGVQRQWIGAEVTR